MILVLLKHCGHSLPVMGASGFSQLTTMEVSPTSSTSWSEGASGAGRRRNVLKNCDLKKRFSELSRVMVKSDDSPVVCDVVRMRLSSPAFVTSYTLTVYFLPGRSSLMLTEVDVRGRSVTGRDVFDT